MLHHFLSPNSLSPAVCFVGYRHQGWRRGGFEHLCQFGRGERAKRGALHAVRGAPPHTSNTDVKRPSFSRRATHRKKSYLVYLSPHLFFISFILFYVAYQRDLQPRGCATSSACTRSCSKPQSTFLLSNLNSYISSAPTPPGTSHFRVDLAACTSAV